jgi:hypothetical protein
MGRSTSAVRRDRDRLLGAVNAACRILVEYATHASQVGGTTPAPQVDAVTMLRSDFESAYHALDSARRAVTGVVFMPKGDGHV